MISKIKLHSTVHEEEEENYSDDFSNKSFPEPFCSATKSNERID